MQKISLIFLVLSGVFYLGSLLTTAWVAPTLGALYLVLLAIYFKK